MSKDIILVVGLGNPGTRYAGTRHNLGYGVVDALADASGVLWRDEKEADIAKEQGFILLKPKQYMNLSGLAVQKVAHFYKVSPDRIVVVHDDIDLKVGVLRAKFGGGSAGHNGIKSIAQQLATPDFWRLRIGCAHPDGAQQVSDYVLSRPSQEQREELDLAISEAVKALESMLQQQDPAALK